MMICVTHSSQVWSMKREVLSCRWLRRRTEPRKLGSNNVENWRRLELSVCIYLHYNETQLENRVGETTNAECDAKIPSHWDTRIIRTAAVVRKHRWRIVKSALRHSLVLRHDNRKILTSENLDVYLWDVCIPYILPNIISGVFIKTEEGIMTINPPLFLSSQNKLDHCIIFLIWRKFLKSVTKLFGINFPFVNKTDFSVIF